VGPEGTERDAAAKNAQISNNNFTQNAILPGSCGAGEREQLHFGALLSIKFQTLYHNHIVGVIIIDARIP